MNFKQQAPIVFINAAMIDFKYCVPLHYFVCQPRFLRLYFSVCHNEMNHFKWNKMTNDKIELYDIIKIYIEWNFVCLKIFLSKFVFYEIGIHSAKLLNFSWSIDPLTLLIFLSYFCSLFSLISHLNQTLNSHCMLLRIKWRKNQPLKKMRIKGEREKRGRRRKVLE